MRLSQCIMVLGVLLLAAAPVQAQVVHMPPERMFCDPESHPNDAVAAAPYSHRVMFEDEHVRVLEIRLPPGAVEPIHIHALPSVIYGETGGAGGAKFVYTEYRMENGKFVEVASNEVTPTAGTRAVWSPPEGPHSISNVGGVLVRFTRVEIKPESCKTL